MRLSRWFVVVPAVVFLSFAVVSAGVSKSSKTLPIRTVSASDVTSKAELQSLARYRGAVLSHRLQTWSCQDSLGVKRSRASVSVWALPRSVSYRVWAAGLWRDRTEMCMEVLRLRTIPTTGDWRTAVALVQRISPGTSAWLLSCSSGEGGHGGFVMNHQGSGAGGWVQFLSSTFYAYQAVAFADARAKGFVIDRIHQSWYDPIGQALTASWMRTHGLSHHWDPNIDPLCR